MKSVAARAQWVVIVVLVATVAAIATFAMTIESRDRLEGWKLCLEATKVVVMGLVGLLLGKVIPAAIADSRHAFERMKESRALYSEVKTGVDYLSVRLCGLSFKDAARYVQRLHVKKHMAETYAELTKHLRKRARRRVWAELMYERLHDVRDLLEVHAAGWDALRPEERLSLLMKQEALTYNRLKPAYGTKIRGKDLLGRGLEDIPALAATRGGSASSSNTGQC